MSNIEKILPKEHPLWAQRDKFVDIPGTSLASGVVEISPETGLAMYQKWNHPRNRPVSDKTVEELAWTILADEYVVNGEPIILGERGSGLDLQHRCLGVNKAGVPIQQLVVAGVPDKLISTIDNERPRSTAAQIKILMDLPKPLQSGYVSAVANFSITYQAWITEMRAAQNDLQLYRRIRKRGPSRQIRSMIAHDLFWMEKHPTWEENLLYIYNLNDVALVGTKNGLWRLNAKIITGVYQVISDYDPVLAKDFFEALRFALRNPLSQENIDSLSEARMKTAYNFVNWGAPSISVNKYPEKTQVRRFTEAFNKYVEGEKVWVPLGRATVDFPVFSVIDLTEQL